MVDQAAKWQLEQPFLGDRDSQVLDVGGVLSFAGLIGIGDDVVQLDLNDLHDISYSFW
jgi:hypothetical protein